MLTVDEMGVFERVDKIHHGLESLEADRSAVGVLFMVGGCNLADPTTKAHECLETH
jgi:hypothetical protein